MVRQYFPSISGSQMLRSRQVTQGPLTLGRPHDSQRKWQKSGGAYSRGTLAVAYQSYSTQHLDRKHPEFAMWVGGEEEVDDHEAPIEKGTELLMKPTWNTRIQT